MPALLPLGSELWLAFYEAKTGAYVPKCVGTISKIIGDRYFAGGKWHQPAYPHFGTEAEARAWIASRGGGPGVPTVK